MFLEKLFSWLLLYYLTVHSVIDAIPSFFHITLEMGPGPLMLGKYHDFGTVWEHQININNTYKHQIINLFRLCLLLYLLCYSLIKYMEQTLNFVSKFNLLEVSSKLGILGHIFGKNTLFWHWEWVLIMDHN